MNHSVQLSPELYELLQQRAAVLNATVDSLVEVAVRQNYDQVAGAGLDQAEKPQPNNGSGHGMDATTELVNRSDDLAQLAFLTDDELWQVAQTRLTTEDQARMEELLLKQQATGLASDELTEAERLADRHDQTMLVRAKAAVLLKERGHDVSNLGPTAVAP